MWNECEHRVELVASGDTAEVDNFGGEGTGLKTMLEVDWRLGETLTLVVTGIQDRAVNEPSRILQCPEEAPTRSSKRTLRSSVRHIVAVMLSHSGQPQVAARMRLLLSVHMSLRTGVLECGKL